MQLSLKPQARRIRMKTWKKNLFLHEPLRHTRLISFIVVVSVVLFGYTVAARSAEEALSEIGPVTEAQAIEAASVNEAYAPDNTGINERDRGGQTLTASDQSNEPDDIEITQTIRRGVMADGLLSFTAKNVKIITVDGAVTLRGPVGSEEEKETIDRLARQASGVANVDNLIEVDSDDQQGDAS
jgi:hypothetical protein